MILYTEQEKLWKTARLNSELPQLIGTYWVEPLKGENVVDQCKTKSGRQREEGFTLEITEK